MTIGDAVEPYGSAPHDDWADQETMRTRLSLWSALQTHLQGGDGATLAVVPEVCDHAQPSLHHLSCGALLASRTETCNHAETGTEDQISNIGWNLAIPSPCHCTSAVDPLRDAATFRSP
ncbi:hypothetical protein EHS39_26065 [Ensifer sp. MPMI2T]|nr:hypothetical protein EHS39_26065 [Ensifer sp. MPMI2T]